MELYVFYSSRTTTLVVVVIVVLLFLRFVSLLNTGCGRVWKGSVNSLYTFA